VDEVFFAGPSAGTDPRTTREAAIRNDFITDYVGAALATGSRSRSSGRRYFASLDALQPCVLKIRIARISALLEPSTAARATTAFAIIFGAALGAVSS